MHVKKDKTPPILIGGYINTIIWSLISLLIIFIPFYVGELETTYTFQILPIIGDGSIIGNFALAAAGFEAGLNFPQFIYYIFFYGMIASLYCFFIISISNVVLSIIMIHTKNSKLLKYFSIISKVFFIALICISFFILTFIIGTTIMFYLGYTYDNAITLKNLFIRNGITFASIWLIFSILLSIKQRKWFKTTY